MGGFAAGLAPLAGFISGLGQYQRAQQDDEERRLRVQKQKLDLQRQIGAQARVMSYIHNNPNLDEATKAYALDNPEDFEAYGFQTAKDKERGAHIAAGLKQLGATSGNPRLTALATMLENGMRVEDLKEVAHIMDPSGNLKGLLGSPEKLWELDWLAGHPGDLGGAADYAKRQAQKYEKPPRGMVIDPSGIVQEVRPGSRMARGSVPFGQYGAVAAQARQLESALGGFDDLLDLGRKVLPDKPGVAGTIFSSKGGPARWFKKEAIGDPDIAAFETQISETMIPLLRNLAGTSRPNMVEVKKITDAFNNAKDYPALKAAVKQARGFATRMLSSMPGGSAEILLSPETPEGLPPDAEELR